MKVLSRLRANPAIRTSAAVVLLASAVGAALLPVAQAIVMEVLVAVIWATLYWPRRRALVVSVGCLLAIVPLAWGSIGDEMSRAALVLDETSVRSYEALWDDLRQQANEAARTVTSPAPEEIGWRLGAFQALGRQVSSGMTGLTLLLVGPELQPVAWAGKGLLHEPDWADLAAGPSFVASYGSVTMLHSESLGAPEWRVVAGRSLATDRLPIDRPENLGSSATIWSLEPAGASIPSNVVVLKTGELPLLVLRESSEGGLESAENRARRAAWLLIGAALLVWAALEVWGRGRVSETIGVVAAALSGVTALALGLGVPLWIVGYLTASLALAFFAWLRSSTRVSSWVGACAVGLLAGLILPGVSYLLQRWLGPIDLGSRFALPATEHALRVAGFALTTAILASLGHSRSGMTPSAGWPSWAGFGLLLISAATHDYSVVALPTLLLGAGLCGVAVWRAARPRATAVAGMLLVMAALISSLGWEIGYRIRVADYFVDELVPALGPPEADLVRERQAELTAFFAEFQLQSVIASDPDGLDASDLAFRIWRESPLSKGGGLSALTVVDEGALVSSFSFGLPTTESPFPDELDGGVWVGPRDGDWGRGLIVGESPLTYSGQLRGNISYRLLLPPAPQIDRLPAGELPGRLLYEQPGRLRIEGAQVPEAWVGFYSTDGDPIATPWAEWRPLTMAELAGDESTVSTPGGLMAVHSKRWPEVVAVAFIPVLGRAAAVERVGTHAVAVLFTVAFAVALAVALSLSRAGFRQAVARAARSYSRRLQILYAVLLLLPLVAFGGVLLQVLEERLGSAKRAAGGAALDSAQHFLGRDLMNMDPGFDIDSVLDDELLGWLSDAVHFDINLYWRSSVQASSRPELFTSGLLPRRIPGEIYAQLSLLGLTESDRNNRSGGVSYQELYAPLRVPGTEGSESLMLSLPLLAQEEELSEEVRSLARRITILTTALLVMLIAIGNRLARSFTEPITELVAGTQRIATGARSLDLEPVETELATLVSAIDRMAVTIAEGREQLLQEKQVVERMVQHITAGVISVDRQGRVMMENRSGSELLGVSVGDDLAAVLARRPELASIEEMLDSTGMEPVERTVRFDQNAGEPREWSVIWVPVPGDGEPTALLVVEDVTEVLRSQRLQAWAEMARIIAHEIKNPLTPIRLSTEHMQQIRLTHPEEFDAVFERCSTNILKQVEELRQISTEFSTYSRILRLERRRGELVSMLTEVVESYRSGPGEGVAVSFLGESGPISMSLDRKMLGRALRNLIENARRLTPDGGSVQVSVTTSAESAIVTVRDTGPGAEPETLRRMFDPYFSTDPGGTGLGLPITRRIVEEHGGRIWAQNASAGGLEVVLLLPLPDEDGPSPRSPTRATGA